MMRQVLPEVVHRVEREQVLTIYNSQCKDCSLEKQMPVTERTSYISSSHDNNQIIDNC